MKTILEIKEKLKELKAKLKYQEEMAFDEFDYMKVYKTKGEIKTLQWTLKN